MQALDKNTTEYRWINILLIATVLYVPVFNPLLPKTNFGAGFPDIDFQRITLLLIFLVIGWKFLFQWPFFRWDNWLNWVLVSALIVFLSPLWSKYYSYDPTLIQDLVTHTLMPFLVAVISLATLNNDKSIKRYCLNAVIVINILSLYAIYQFITKTSFSEGGELRSSATFGNANLLAIYLVLLQPIIIYVTETKKIPKWLGYLTFVIFLVAIATTVSRKGIITAIITFEIYFFLTHRYKQLIISVIALILAALLAAGYSEITKRFDNSVLEKDYSGKVAMVDAGIKMFKKQPIIGYGYKGYYENFYYYFRSYGHRKKYDAHNEYITTLVNFGLVGFVFFMGVFLVPFRKGWLLLKQYRQKKMSEETMRIMVGLASLVSFMISQYFAGVIYYHSPLAVCLLFANIGLMLAGNRQITIRSEDELR